MRVGLLWRREWDPPSADPPKLHGVFAAFGELGVAAEAVVYDDDAVDDVRRRLRELDGVLVWVNPVEQGLDRSRLDPLLREAADHGVFVSAHPDVILRMGTKEVLVDTRSLTWGTDTRLYRTVDELLAALPGRLAEAGPLVLKQHRGMGGHGVWKLELNGDGSMTAQHAAGASAPERVTLAALGDRFRPYFAGHGLMVEQPYLARVRDGMIRVYLSHDVVVGFTHQYPRGLLPPAVETRPSTKVFEPVDTPAYAELRQRLEREWVPELQRLLDLRTEQLPVIWDADFLFGDRADEYVLCEINVSSTFAFPEFAMPTVAAAALERMRQR